MSKDATTLNRSVDSLIAALSGREAEVEQARTAPKDIVEKMRAAGIMGMHVSEKFGGAELPFPEGVAVLRRLAAADASIAWLAAQASHAPMVAHGLPVSTLERIYRDGAGVAWANSLMPAGQAEIVEGGYRVTGRWPFASGCRHADMMFAVALVTKDGQPAPGPAPGMPSLVVVALPAARWKIVDTWRASGLKGTGSDEIHLDGETVDEADTFGFLTRRSATPGPLLDHPLALIPLQFAAICVGVAEGAIADVSALVKGGKRNMGAGRDQRDSEAMHFRLGQMQASVQAAAALLEKETDAQWARARADAFDEASLVEMHQALAWIARTCAQAVDEAYTIGGGHAVYDDSPLQRRLRDIHAVTQHVTLNERHFVPAGEILAGKPARNPMFG